MSEAAIEQPTTTATEATAEAPPAQPRWRAEYGCEEQGGWFVVRLTFLTKRPPEGAEALVRERIQNPTVAAAAARLAADPATSRAWQKARTLDAQEAELDERLRSAVVEAERLRVEREWLAIQVPIPAAAILDLDARAEEARTTAARTQEELRLVRPARQAAAEYFEREARQAGEQVGRRFRDALDPELREKMESILASVVPHLDAAHDLHAAIEGTSREDFARWGGMARYAPPDAAAATAEATDGTSTPASTA